LGTKNINKHATSVRLTLIPKSVILSVY